MNYNEITMDHVRNFLRWWKSIEQESIFTKKGLWEIQKECTASDLEIYWNGEGLGEESVQKILEDGLAGREQVWDEIWSHNSDTAYDIKEEFIKQITMSDEMLTEAFKKEMRDLYDIEDIDTYLCEIAEDEIYEFIREKFEEELDVDYGLDQAIKNTSGEIWIDDEDTCAFEIFSKEHIKMKSEELLFFTNSKYDTLQKDLYEEAFGTEKEWLNEPIEFSVCVADSLEEYIDILIEHEKEAHAKDPDGKIPEMTFDAVINTVDSTKTISLNNTIYCSTEANYSEPAYITSIGIAEEGHNVDDDEPNWSSYDDFVDGVKEIVNDEAKKYVEKHLHNPKRLDIYGRTLMHYALVLQDKEIFKEVVDGLTIHAPTNLYDTDNEGVSPLFIIKDSLDNEFEEMVYKTLYFPLIEFLPTENETAGQWSAKSSLKAIINPSLKVEEFLVVERRGVPRGRMKNDEALLVLNLQDNEYSEVKLSQLDYLTPAETVEIYLDGSVAA